MNINVQGVKHPDAPSKRGITLASCARVLTMELCMRLKSCDIFHKPARHSKMLCAKGCI